MNTKKKNILKMVGILILGLLLGWLIFGGKGSNESNGVNATEQKENTTWTCSMHPQIRQSEPGNCPICGMELIPLESNHSDADPDAIQMSENAMKLANVQTLIVGEMEANKELRLNGKVQVDERKLYAQSTHIPGRIEQLKVNFTGEKVSRGQTLAMVYSPELVTAQEELLQANGIKESQPELFDAAKEKLRNWKIAESTINKIIISGKPIQRFPISADVSGIVTEKKVELGDYVDRGMTLYEITDLSAVWVLLDVYESDIPWVKVGQKVNYKIQSLPGETFEGKITFIDPFINPQTRVASARVEVKNTGNRLKPEMFVSGIIKNDLNKKVSKEIVIPKSAVMWTGERSIVYIKQKEDNKVSFKLRQVTLGPSLGDAYVIKDGLVNGEEIVVNGTFTVDAASQLAGKPSMMNPEGSKQNLGHAGMDMGGDSNEKSTETKMSEEEMKNMDASKMENRMNVSKDFQNQLKKVLENYISLKDALASDDSNATKISAVDVLKYVSKIDMKLLKNKDAHDQWMTISKEVATSATSISKSSDIEIQRSHFRNLSTYLIKAIKLFGVNQKVYEQFCPMADTNKGAYWLSFDEKIKNPYFGSKMLQCGSTESIIE